MRSFIRFAMVLCTGIAGCLIAAGCVSQKTIDTYEARLKVLEEKGLPDSVLSTIRVYLTQAKEGKRRSNGMIAKAGIDSVKSYILKAEKWSDGLIQTTKPYVDSLLQYFNEKKKTLTGLQLKQADSLLAIIDSHVRKNWYMQARTFVDYLDTLLPVLLADEANAAKVAANIAGKWTLNKKHTEDGANALEKTLVTFGKDGTFQMNEEMKGLTKPMLKEDWQFESAGTYAIKGDTILLTVKKEKCLRETYWNLVDKGGKQEWVKSEKKPYEKEITDGSKDRFFTYEYLKESFKK